MTTGSPWFRRLSLFATVLALAVVVLGAYVRLSDAGLGCPDWPGCYGHVGVPESAAEVTAANAAFPERPVEVAKGWKEMIHRYFAGALGLAMATLAVLGWRRRREPGQQWKLPLFLVALVVFQAILGMWTVTWKLKPFIVMLHLMGGMTILSLLAWQTLRAGWGPRPGALPRLPGLRAVLLAAIVVAAGQIALGGWTSTNYAAVACNEFPTCTLGTYWPADADFARGFDFWHGIGPNYEFGVHLDNDAKVAIHLVHRVGAIITLFVLGALAVALWRAVPGASASRGALALTAALCAQILFGISNVVFNLPLWVAVAHNAGAAVLLIVLVTLNHQARPVPTS